MRMVDTSPERKLTCPKLCLPFAQTVHRLVTRVNGKHSQLIKRYDDDIEVLCLQ